MARKRNRPPLGKGGAVLEADLFDRRIDRDNSPARPETQEPRLAAYRLDAALVVIEVAYA